MQKILVSALAIALSAALAGPALAQSTARASATLRIYAGPSHNYGVIGRLKRNSVVTLNRCTRSGTWCQLDDRRGGWVLASYLVGTPAKVEAAPPTFLVPFFGVEPEDRPRNGLGTFPFR